MIAARTIGLPAIAVAVTIAAAPSPARAQCGETPSTCVGCHDMTATDDHPWHRDHAFADLCVRCHGGDPLATESGPAHAGSIDPLADPRATCGSCHPDDAVARARRYAVQVDVDPDGDDGVVPVSPATVVATAPSAGPPNDSLLAIAILAIAAIECAAILIIERRRRGLRSRATIASLFARPSWSPYLAGALVGVVVAISMCVFGRRLSGAGAYQSLSGYAGAPLAPRSPYWSSIVKTGMTWDVWILVGTFVGAYASAATSGQLRLRTMPDARWIEAFGPRVTLRWALVFVGTAVLSIAAGIAGGCTASLVLSGGAVLAPGAFVFMAAMFVGGAPVAWLAARRARRGRS